MTSGKFVDIISTYREAIFQYTLCTLHVCKKNQNSKEKGVFLVQHGISYIFQNFIFSILSGVVAGGGGRVLVVVKPI
jgi:hypothetical protein